MDYMPVEHHVDSALLHAGEAIRLAGQIRTTLARFSVSRRSDRPWRSDIRFRLHGHTA